MSGNSRRQSPQAVLKKVRPATLPFKLSLLNVLPLLNVTLKRGNESPISTTLPESDADAYASSPTTQEAMPKSMNANRMMLRIISI